MKNRDFTIEGINFHLCDNFPRGYKPPRAEFEGKYYVMYQGGEQWFPLGLTVNTKKEAVEELKMRALPSKRWFPFDY